MVGLFEGMMTDGTYSKKFKKGDIEIRDWFRDKALSTRKREAENVVNDKTKTTSVVVPRIGRLLMYAYDPKHKATLPYYDNFPVIFPIEFYKDGWLGLNMHYLPPMFRARLMDALYSILNNQKYNDSTRLRISYKILKNAAKYKYFKPCVKRYLHSHVRSNLVEVDVKEWDYVAFLPLAKFQKQRQRQVWDQSVKTIMESG